eukprot:scaffold51974_cov74-Phaeocystis_antarctica.AAC.1
MTISTRSTSITPPPQRQLAPPLPTPTSAPISASPSSSPRSWTPLARRRLARFPWLHQYTLRNS